MKLVSSDLPRPNLAEEDNYDDGRVKKSAAGASTKATRSRQRSSSSPATMEVAAALGFEKLKRERVRSSGVKEVRKGKGVFIATVKNCSP